MKPDNKGNLTIKLLKVNYMINNKAITIRFPKQHILKLELELILFEGFERVSKALTNKGV